MPNDEVTQEFLQLFLQAEPSIRGCVLVLVPNWNDAQDITQQISVILWRKFDQFDRGTNFLSWARTIARHEAKAYWKKQSDRKRLFSETFVDAVAAETDYLLTELDDRRAMLKFCMDRLKPSHRELLFLRYEEGRPVEEISERLSRSVDSIYKAIARLRVALLECVKSRTASVNRR
jgi:RNA polymerase sigma-70 factor, ECF subfamily